MKERWMDGVWRRTKAILPLTLVLSFAPIAAPAQEGADSTRNSPAISAEAQVRPPVPRLFTGGDLMFLGGTIAGTALAMRHDRWLTERAAEVENNPTQRSLARFFEPLGQTPLIVPVALAGWGVARWTKHPEVGRRFGRVALAVGISSVVTQGLKRAVGRERPEDSPNSSTDYRPFSGASAFPSGHASTAFAAAVAIDRETNGRWIPYVVYPAAALVAWSRVHDRKHWTSDVVGGAALGAWTAWKTETFLEHHSIGVMGGRKGGGAGNPPAPGDAKSSLLLMPEPGGFRVALVRVFD